MVLRRNAVEQSLPLDQRMLAQVLAMISKKRHWLASRDLLRPLLWIRGFEEIRPSTGIALIKVSKSAMLTPLSPKQNGNEMIFYAVAPKARAWILSLFELLQGNRNRQLGS